MKTLVLSLLRNLFRVLFRIELRGKFPAKQPERLLIVANHESFLDGFLLALFLPMNPVFVVHTWVAQHWLFGTLLKLVDFLAVDPTSPMAIKQVVKIVDSGRPVVIFPEGRITVTGSLMKVYDGPAFIAARTRAEILPIRLDGPSRTYFSRMSGEYPRQWFPKMTLSILPLETITLPAEGKSRERRRLAGEALRRIMQHMIFATRPLNTLYESFLDAIRLYGRKRRLVEDMRQVEHSYGEILKMTLGLGRIVSKITSENERVGVLLPNVVPTLGLILGATAFRRVPAMLNYTAGFAGLDAACTAAEVKTIIASRAFIQTARLEEVVEKLAAKYRVVYLEDLKSTLKVADKLWLIFTLLFPRTLIQQSRADDAAVVLFTSGSEGVPKGVVLSHQNLLANMAQMRSVIDFASDDKFLNALPIFHAFGLTAGALLPLMTGTRLFLYPSPLHYRVIPEVAYDRNCTVLFGTSTFLGNYARYAHPYDFYRLRYVVAGAEKLSSAVREIWFEKFGIRILEGYGATETAPVLAVNTPMAYRTSTVGQFLPGVEYWLEPVPGIDEGGLLHVKGPNIMAGYNRVAAPGVLEATESEHGAGWYNTGDIVNVDTEGFVRICGRLKRFAKIAGEMVSLETVEKLATLASPEGMHAASSKVDENRGEALVLFTTAAIAPDKLAAIARENGITALAVPRDIRIVKELPLLGTGKTDYVTLKKMAEA